MEKLSELLQQGSSYVYGNYGILLFCQQKAMKMKKSMEMKSFCRSCENFGVTFMHGIFR